MTTANLDIAAQLGVYETRLVADRDGPDRWIVRVALRDRRGALAAIAGSFARAGIAVRSAAITTGPGGIVIDVFHVDAASWTDWEAVRRMIDASLAAGHHTRPPEPIEATVIVADDGDRSTVTVVALDRVGLLARLAGAMSHAGLQIHAATITTTGTQAVDTFEVTGANGAALTKADRRALDRALAGLRVRRGLIPRRR